MSPSSTPRSTAGYGPVGGRDFGGVGELLAGGNFGVRSKQPPAAGGPPLKVSKESHRIRKPPLPLPQVQYRPPVIIHTYSPKVLHTEPDDFMSLVQKLTGSSDTRLRLKKTKPSSKKSSDSQTSNAAELPSEPIRPAGIQRQGSGTSSTCGSPSSSSEENFVAAESVSIASELIQGPKVVKQSNSPRSPFDSDFDFDSNDSSLSGMFSHFDNSTSSIAASVPGGGNSVAPSGMFQVKAEPMFSFTDNTTTTNSSSSFNVFTDTFIMNPAKQMPRQMHPLDALSYNINNIDPNQSGYLLAGLPDLAWSSFDGTTPHFINQAPYLRQRAYGSTSEGTLVSLENLHAYSLN